MRAERASGSEGPAGATPSGELIVSEALADPSLAKRVPAQAGRTTTSDAPFAEAKEHLAGFFLIECESIERALEIAARVPEAAYGRGAAGPGPQGDGDLNTTTDVEDLLRELATRSRTPGSAPRQTSSSSRRECFSPPGRAGRARAEGGGCDESKGEQGSSGHAKSSGGRRGDDHRTLPLVRSRSSEVERLSRVGGITAGDPPVARCRPLHTRRRGSWCPRPHRFVCRQRHHRRRGLLPTRSMAAVLAH